MHSEHRHHSIARSPRRDITRSGAARHVLLAATASLLLLAFAPVDAHAEPKGLGGGGGGGLGGGIGVGNHGIGTPGNGVGIPGSGPQLPSTPDGVRFGVTIPSGFGDSLQPALPRPDAAGAVVNSKTTGVTNTLTNKLSNGRGARGTIGDGINRSGASGSPAAPRRSGVPLVGERRFVPDEVVVGLPSSLSRRAVDDLASRHRLAHVESQDIGLLGTTFHRWRIADHRSVSDVIRALETEGGVSRAQPNYRYTLQQSRSAAATEMEPLQYALAKLRLPQAHRVSTGDKVLIAVIDTSIDAAHPEIAGMVAGSFNATNAADLPHPHGTAIAGVMVANARLKGVAPAARILAIHAFDASGTTLDGTTLTILRGIDWAVARGARVINMSFAGPNDPGLARSLAAARQKGVVLVAAAGNAGPISAPLFPAADPNVIAVTATNAHDKLLPGANRGHHIAVAAPGVDILGPAPGESYQLSTGTSVAAAHVSGVVALLLARKPDLTPEAVRRILLSSATDLGPKGRDDQFGAGLTDAYRAVQSLDADVPENVSAAR
jgi:Subtilase family/Fervidolysin N-terminal prodomain